MTLIALLTDFGETDGYVAAMKATILGLCPEVRLLDLTHGVRPQAIDQGAYLLGTVFPYLPSGTIVVAVVDPGVGTSRRGLAIAVPDATLIGPDNGLFSDVLARFAMAGGGDPGPPEPAQPIALPAGCRGVELTEAAYWRPEVSSTFHGRDIFAPVAAHLARGVPLEALGPPVSAAVRIEPAFERDGLGRIVGRVRHIDRFGNVITSIPIAALSRRRWCVRLAGRAVEGLVRTYGEGCPGQVQAMAGSSGHLEVAVPLGHAASELGVAIGDPVFVEPEEA
ncbi:MAG TPA: SAM-dependent chlorinase/fluorinase [Dehalococcoidia bacterium]|nr:SAM-dependent chlorinase/fluorinase [Dehalococcoidia bacterium]